MPTWLDTLHDPRPIQAIYGSVVPALAPVALHEIRLHRDGPAVTLRLALPEFPAEPPPKWVAQQANTVQIELMLDGVRSISLSGWGTEPVIDLSIVAEEGSVRAVGSGEQVRFDIHADVAIIARLSAYHDELRRGQPDPAG